MANALYDLGREGFLTTLNWSTDTIKAVLVDAALYTVNLATDEFLSDIPSGARTATSPTLTGKTVAAGVADATDVTFAAVAPAAAQEALVLFVDTGSAVTSRLIAYIDTATGLPVTPNGGDVLVTFDNGSSKIFKL